MSESSQDESENEIIVDVPEPVEVPEDAPPTQVFQQSPFTLTDYLERKAHYTTIQEHEDALKQCVALAFGVYVVKRRERLSFRYEILNGSQLGNILDFYMPYRRTVPSHTSAAGRAIAEKTSEGKYNPFKDSIKNAIFQRQLAFFGETALMSSDPQVLSLYVPPTGEYNRAIIERFIHFMESRVNNPEALHEELTAHAYRFRHEDAFIRKVFVHFAAEGKTGKTFLANAFHLLYPHLSMIGTKAKAIQGQFTGWTTDYLNLSFEELENNEEKKTKFMATFIKQATSGATNARRLYHDQEEAEYRCIVSMNTNSPDLYGLIWADAATQERLVILDFKKAPPQEEWDAFITEIGLMDRDPEYRQKKNKFAASFYQYLRTEYTNPNCPDLNDWSPERYYGEDKTNIIRRLQSGSNKLTMRFVRALQIQPPEWRWQARLVEHPLTILEPHRFGLFLSNENLRAAFSSFEMDPNERRAYTVQAVINYLREIGFVAKQTKDYRGYVIAPALWTAWQESLRPPEEEEEEDEEDDTPPTASSSSATTTTTTTTAAAAAAARPKAKSKASLPSLRSVYSERPKEAYELKLEEIKKREEAKQKDEKQEQNEEKKEEKKDEPTE